MPTEVEKVRNCILKYDIRNIKTYVSEALDAGADPGAILDDGMISAMTEIGDGFKENRIYMPQMLVAAKTMQAGLDVLKPHLKGEGTERRAGRAVVGAVAGDVHDIGKNLVSIMLEGAGLEVVDLGSDVTTDRFMDALRENPGTRFLACSSSMTPTRESLRAVLQAVRGSELSETVVMVGGATMDQLFCDEIGADIYTADAASAAQRAKQIADGDDLDEVRRDSAAVAMSLLNVAGAAAVGEKKEEKDEGMPRHSRDAPIRAVGHADSKPLSIKENFIETLKHDSGCPDRYVDQYGFFDIIYDPIVTCCMGLGKGAPDVEYKDGWGCPNILPAGAGGPHPVHGPGKTVIPDITRWEEYLTPSQLDFPESEWEKTKPLMEAADAAGRFRGVWLAQGIFERVHYLLGMKEALVEYYEHPDEMHELIDALTEWEIESLDRTMERIHPQVLFHHDDWGTAINSFLDPDTHRAFFEEPYKRVYKHFRELGGEYVVHHCDSYAANLVPLMIDLGIDVWQGPIESNNIPELIDRYGDRIVFMGGIDDGAVDVPDWTPEAVSSYVERVCDENGTISFIPCLTRGRGRSIYPGVYDRISETIAEISARKF